MNVNDKPKKICLFRPKESRTKIEFYWSTSEEAVKTDENDFLSSDCVVTMLQNLTITYFEKEFDRMAK